MGIEQIIQNPEWEWDYENIYIHPHIPERKISGALNSYAPKVHPTEVIVLLDDTVFGGAREGLIITKTGIFAKQKLDNSQGLLWKDVKSVEMAASSTIMVNGAQFFKANIVDHFAMLTLSARLAAVLGMEGISSRKPANRSPNGFQTKESLLRLHRITMSDLRRELEEECLNLDELIDRQMNLLIDKIPNIYEEIDLKIEENEWQQDASIITLEIALMVFLAMHYYAFSKLPRSFKDGMGEDITKIYVPSELYKEAFREQFESLFGRGMEMDEESLMMISLMFFNRDGEGDFQLKIPREEAVKEFIGHIGLSTSIVSRLISDFDASVAWWLTELFKDL